METALPVSGGTTTHHQEHKQLYLQHLVFVTPLLLPAATKVILSGDCSTCFGWYHHPSSRAHTTVSTASGICHTVTATCRYRARVGTGLSVLWVAYHPKHAEQLPEINKLCNVASCWMYIAIYLRCTDPWTLNHTSSTTEKLSILKNW